MGKHDDIMFHPNYGRLTQQSLMSALLCVLLRLVTGLVDIHTLIYAYCFDSSGFFETFDCFEVVREFMYVNNVGIIIKGK